MKLLQKPVRLALVGSPAFLDAWTDPVSRTRECVIAKGEPEAVVVETAAEAVVAAQAGRHVLFGVPGETMVGMRDVLATCRDAGVHLTAGGCLRHAPSNVLIKERVDSGKLGAPGLLRVHRWRGSTEAPWECRIFADIDLALHLMGGLPDTLFAMTRREGAYLQVHLGFPGGAMAILDFATSLPPGQCYDSLSLVGTKGTAYADDHSNTHLLFTGAAPRALVSRGGDGRFGELRAFLAGIHNPCVPEAEWMAACKVVDGVQESLSLDGPVTFGEGGLYHESA